MTRTSIRWLAFALVGLLALPGCEALDFLLDLYEVSDLTEDDDPAVQAAGHSAEITEKIEQADQTVQEVLNGDEPPETLDDLRTVRPRDAKIANYVFWLAMLEGDTALMSSASESARRLHSATAGGDPGTVERLWLEQNLDVMSDIIGTQAPAADEASVERFGRLQRRYCDTLGSYARSFGSTPDGGLYLTFANDRGCGAVG